MDHLAGYLFWSILVIAALRMGAGALTGWLMARLLKPFGSMGGHIMAGLTGAVIIPVFTEKILGAPMTLINNGMASNAGMAILIAYIIGFSAASAAFGVWLYRNIRLSRPQG